MKEITETMKPTFKISHNGNNTWFYIRSCIWPILFLANPAINILHASPIDFHIEFIGIIPWLLFLLAISIFERALYKRTSLIVYPDRLYICFGLKCTEEKSLILFRKEIIKDIYPAHLDSDFQSRDINPKDQRSVEWKYDEILSYNKNLVNSGLAIIGDKAKYILDIPDSEDVANEIRKILSFTCEGEKDV